MRTVSLFAELLGGNSLWDWGLSCRWISCVIERGVLCHVLGMLARQSKDHGSDLHM
jgi:hypothetical protein